MNRIHLYIYIFIFWGSLGCKKYLDKVPDAALTVPATLDDFNALLNNPMMTNNNPSIGEIGSDDYYLGYPTYQSLYSKVLRNAYTWQPDILEGTTSFDWNVAYQQVYYANIVLDNIGKVVVTSTNQAYFNQIKGRALFCRAFAFYNLAQLFAKPYSAESATAELGLPLRISSDLNAKLKRSTIEQTYARIIKDFSEAANLLPITINSSTPNIASKPAALAMLSRVYLIMQNYPKALSYADSTLGLYSTLLDYNSIDTSGAISFAFPANEEVMYQAYGIHYFWFTGSSTIVDTNLYASFETNDLRKQVYFATRASTGTKYFKGSYTGNYFLFCGIASDEVYLIRAECHAREGNVSGAMKDLNTLLEKRYKSGTFIPLTTTDADTALAMILKERRKELIFRQLRWTDLRRLNQESRFAITLKRVLNGQTYTLPPNDPRYVYPIPNDEIELSGIEQNPR